jgi:acetaldehyde dehydrogenase/alcohol dehydrogenase
MKTCRMIVNSPSSLGGIGDIYNFALAPSLTLGCGSWGGNSTSENVGVRHLLNIKTMAIRRENMMWFRAPAKVYRKKGCLSAALGELGAMGCARAFVVTDAFLDANGYTKPVIAALERQGIAFSVFSDVAPDPTLACAKAGAAAMARFKPDVIVALGGGSAMDAAKIMWVLYEHPECDFADLAMRFMDIRKRVSPFPAMGTRARFVAVPTTAGTGSEVTPFAVITDETTGVKYPLADYEIMPSMAIVDADLQMSAPPGLTAASGIDALSHALEAYASMMASGFTDALALQALKDVFRFLPACYDAAVAGRAEPEARERMADAATMAGMAFANAFLGVMHAMAHKLGSFFHLPHGIANALMMEQTLRFNASSVPRKMGTFPQYGHPHARERYLELADALGIAGADADETFEAFVAAVRALQARVGIKPTIRDYVPDEADFLARLDEMVEQAFDDQCVGTNPRYPLLSEIRQMYLNAYYGKNDPV